MKSHIVFRAALPAVLLIMLCSIASGSHQQTATFVKGTVTLSNRPLRSVWVIVSQNGEEKGRSLTGDDGKYYIGSLSDGVYDIVVVRGKQQVYNSRITLPGSGSYNIVL